MNVIQFLKRHACLVSAVSLLVGQATFSSAQTILIDFGNDNSYRGLSVPGADSNGNYWNSVQPGILVPNLVSITNTSTPTQLAWDTPVATDSYNGPAGPTAPSPPAFPHYYDFLPLTDIDSVALGNMGGAKEAAFDFAASPGLGTHDINGNLTDNKTRFEIQGLDPTLTYDFSFFGSHSHEGDPTTVYSVYSDSAYTNQVGTVNLNVRDPADVGSYNRDTIATISNLAPPSSTILYVQFVGNTGDLGYLNEMRVQATGVAPGVTGDYNQNGVVDAADYVLWRNSVGTTTVLPNDPVGGTIGAAQYNNWRLDFGKTAGAGSALGAGAVPEPASLMMALFGAIGLFSLKRHR
ncbi:MAG TPA: PEP-CTERM sorting domain-containing protein [Lacipirellulaceae bacterium]|jgi:hypothetical protein|nr:PEP-CTERM sorting domain-containing protein [Lacipirellulaceae bacterium]